MASTLGNWASMDRHVPAEPPRERVTEDARTTDDGSGCDGSDSVCVRKRVPEAIILRGR